MEPVSLITGALLAGLKDVSTQAIIDAYTGLKSLIINRFNTQGKPEGEIAVKKFEEKPEAWQGALENLLKEIKIQNDSEIIEAAQNLAQLAAPKQFAQGKFTVQAETIQSVTQADKIDNLTQTFEQCQRDKE